MSYRVPYWFNYPWQSPVADRHLTAPPGSPAKGNRYIVASGGSGAWSGKDKYFATYNGSGWTFEAPVEGMCSWVSDENIPYYYNGSTWTALFSPGPTGPTGPTGPAGSSAAPSNLNYLVLAADGTLSAERILSPGRELHFLDGGAGGDLQICSSTYIKNRAVVGHQHTGVGTSSVTTGLYWRTVGTWAGSINASGPRARGYTTNVINNTTNLYDDSFTRGSLGGSPYFVSHVGTYTSIADCALWVGLSSVAPGTDSTHDGDCVTFRYDSSVDGNWHLITRTGGVETDTDCAVAVNTSTDYKLEIYYDGTNVYWAIDGSGSSVGTDIPAVTVALGPWIGVYTRAAAAKSIYHRSSWLLTSA